MAEVLETDLFLVEREGQNYQTPGSNMAELLDDDLMLVERDGTCYKATGEEIKESLGGGTLVFGSIDQPTVLGPQQEEITGGLVYLKSDEIIAVDDAGGTVVYETSAINAETTVIANQQKAPASDPTSFSAFSLEALLDGQSNSNVQLAWDNSSGNEVSDVLRFNFSTPVSGEVAAQFTSTNSQPAVSVYTTLIPGGTEVRNTSKSSYSSQFVSFGSFTDITAIELKAHEVGGGFVAKYQQITIDGSIPNLPYSAGGQLLTFTDDTNFDKFQVGDDVGGASITDINYINNQMTLDADVKNVGDKLVKETTYDTTITCATDKDLNHCFTGASVMTDGTTGPYSQTPYLVQSDEIVSVSDLNAFTLMDGSIPGLGVEPAGGAYLQTSGQASTSEPFAKFTFADAGLPATTTGDVVVNMMLLQQGGGGWSAVPSTVYLDNGTTTWTFVSQLGTNLQNVTFTVPAGATYFAFAPSVTSASGGVSLLTVGNIVFGNITVPNSFLTGEDTSLTFASDQNLENFRVGDVVASKPGTIDAQVTSLLRFSGAADLIDTCSTNTQYFAGNCFLSNSYGGGGGGITAYVTATYPEGTYLTTSSGDIFKQGSQNTIGVQVAFTDNRDTFIDAPYDANDQLYKLLTDGKKIAQVRTTLDKSWGGGETKTFNLFYIESVDGTITQPTLKGAVPVSITAIDPDNNQMAVDGGNWVVYNDSEVWSNNLTGVGLTNPENAFDNDTDSYADTTGGWSLDLSGYNFGTGLHTINVKSGGATAITINSDGALPNPGGSGAVTWTGTYTGEINTIASSAVGASLYYVEIDGRVLVDTGVIDLGDTNVTYQTTGGKGDVVGVSGNDIYLNTSTDTDDRWIVNQGFSVGGPTCIEEPTLTADIELTSSPFVINPTDPAVNPGILPSDQYYIWTINGVEYPGVNVNPWEPGFLETNTMYTISVKQMDLTGQYLTSPESPNFSFTTGAALNLYSLFASEIAAYRSTL